MGVVYELELRCAETPFFLLLDNRGEGFHDIVFVTTRYYRHFPGAPQSEHRLSDAMADDCLITPREEQFLPSVHACGKARRQKYRIHSVPSFRLLPICFRQAH